MRDLSHLHPPDAVHLFVTEETAVSSLEAEVRATFRTAEESHPAVNAEIKIRRPDSFRMLAYPKIGPTIFDLVIRDRKILFYVPDEETLYVDHLDARRPEKGERKGPDLQAIFGRTGMADLFLGTQLGGQREVKYIHRSAEGLKLAILAPSGIVQSYIWLDPVTLFKTRQVVIGEGGKVALELRFSEYEEIEDTGFYWPRRIDAASPVDRFSLTMQFDLDSILFNQDLEPDLFEMDLPEDVKRVERKPDDAGK